MKTRMAGLRSEQSAFVMKLALLKRKLMRIDREWIRCRETYSRSGHEPSVWRALVRTVPLVLLGSLVTAVPLIPHSGNHEIPLVGLAAAGLIILCIGLSRGLGGIGRALRFHRIHRRYRIKRRELVARIRHEERRGC